MAGAATRRGPLGGREPAKPASLPSKRKAKRATRERKDVRAGATAPRTSLWHMSLSAIVLAGKQGGRTGCFEVCKLRETAR